MRALSLTRPWAFAFLNGSPSRRKRIENRSWRPPDDALGQRIALHSAKSWDAGDRLFIQHTTGLSVPDKSQFPHSVIFAVCTVASWISPGRERLMHGNPRTVFDDYRKLMVTQEQWYMGGIAWVLSDIVALPKPVSHKGALSLWSVSPEAEADILTQLSGVS